MLNPLSLFAGVFVTMCVFSIASIDLQCDKQPPTIVGRMVALAAADTIQSDSPVIVIDMNEVAFTLAKRSQRTIAVSTTPESTALWKRPCIPRAQKLPEMIVNASIATVGNALPAWAFDSDHRVFIIGSREPGMVLKSLKHKIRNGRGSTSVIVVNGCCGLKPSVVNLILQKTNNFFDCTCVTK
ncbi:MAG: hypothetical protein CL678_00870 [Bdellovibrionaceae bacterium]|nr:hypothetical protein [Pseudobdellovibrionaceae bacterium]|tara:strand:- start:3096 stop:3647 length:552 start_codon:yes stop_codon:yes gene_type:complete